MSQIPLEQVEVVSINEGSQGDFYPSLASLGRLHEMGFEVDAVIPSDRDVVGNATKFGLDNLRVADINYSEAAGKYLDFDRIGNNGWKLMRASMNAFAETTRVVFPEYARMLLEKDPERTLLMFNPPGFDMYGKLAYGLGFKNYVTLSPYFYKDPWLQYEGAQNLGMHFLPGRTRDAIFGLVSKFTLGGLGDKLAREYFEGPGRQHLQASDYARMSYDLLSEMRLQSLYAISRQAVDPRELQNPRVRVTGYPYPEETGSVHPDTEKFIGRAQETNTGIIAFTAGSMKPANMDSYLQTIQKASGGMPMVVVKGWSDMHVTETDKLHVIKHYSPYQALLPRMLTTEDDEDFPAVLVSHLGSGSYHSAIWAGIPVIGTVVLPDQRAWAQKAVDLGISPGYMSMRDIDANTLKDYFERALHPSMQQRARQISELVQQEPGLDGIAANMVEAMEDIASGRR